MKNSLAMALADSTAELDNLYETPPDGALAPEAGLDMLTTGEWVPVCNCGEGLFLSSAAGRVRVMRGVTVALEADTGSVVRCGVVRDREVIIMTENGPCFFDFDGSGWSYRGFAPQWPAVKIKADVCGTLQQRVGEFVPSDVDLRRTVPLSEKDRTRLTGMMTEAYTELTAVASAAGMWIQPVMVRSRLVDAEGATLYLSAPVIAGAPDGWQLVDTLTTGIDKQSDTSVTVGSFMLSASAFRLAVELPDYSLLGEWGARVAAVEILATEQIHPFDFGEMAACRVEGPSGLNPVLRVAMPGATSCFADNDIRRQEMVISLLSHREEAMTCIARFDGPVAPGSVTVENRRISSPETSMARIGRLISSKTERLTPLLCDTASPHSFSARCVVQSGDAVVWGDVTPLVSAGYPMAELDAGEGLLSPLVVCPDVRAPYMEMGGVRLSLTPVEDGTCSCYVAPGLRPVRLADGSGLQTVASPRPRRPGALMGAKSGAPLEISSVLTIDGSRILALTPAARSQSSWDFSRCHIYAFTSGGIHAVSVNASRRLVSATMIDTRAVTGRVAFTPIGVCAPFQGQILAVAGARASVLSPDADAVSVGWDAGRRRLLVLTSQGVLMAMDEKGRCRRRIAASVADAGSIGSMAWAVADGALLSPGSVARPSTSMMWRGQVAIPPGWRATGVTIDMQGACCICSVSVVAGCGERLTLLNAEGTICRPLNVRLASPVRRSLSVCLEGDVSPDFRLHGVTLRIARI